MRFPHIQELIGGVSYVLPRVAHDACTPKLADYAPCLVYFLLAQAWFAVLFGKGKPLVFIPIAVCFSKTLKSAFEGVTIHDDRGPCSEINSVRDTGGLLRIALIGRLTEVHLQVYRDSSLVLCERWKFGKQQKDMFRRTGRGMPLPLQLTRLMFHRWGQMKGSSTTPPSYSKVPNLQNRGFIE